jgi:hypothetical protein
MSGAQSDDPAKLPRLVYTDPLDLSHQVKAADGGDMGVIYNGAGQLIERDSKYPRLERWWARAKRWALWLGAGSICSN